MEQKLKECPFCGGEAHLSYAVGTGERKRTIGCLNDDCLNTRWWKDESEISEEDLIKIWNTRLQVTGSQPKEVGELVRRINEEFPRLTELASYFPDEKLNWLMLDIRRFLQSLTTPVMGEPNKD